MDDGASGHDRIVEEWPTIRPQCFVRNGPGVAPMTRDRAQRFGTMFVYSSGIPLSSSSEAFLWFQKDSVSITVGGEQMNAASYRADDGDQGEYINRQFHPADGVIGLGGQQRCKDGFSSHCLILRAFIGSRPAVIQGANDRIDLHAETAHLCSTDPRSNRELHCDRRMSSYP